MSSMYRHEEAPNASSGTSTPPPSTISSSYLPGPVMSAVSGLLRRLSYNADSSPKPSTGQIPHASTFPSSQKDSNNGIDNVYTPPHRNLSPFQPPPLYPLSLKGYEESTAPSARLLSRAIAEEIRLLVPPRLQLCEEWNLVYSLEQDGASIGTLYKKCDDLRGLRNGFVLVVRDGDGGVSSKVPVVPSFLMTKPNPKILNFRCSVHT